MVEKKNTQILIAEDEPEISRLLAEGLMRNGFDPDRFRYASTLRDLTDLLKKKEDSYGLILLDPSLGTKNSLWALPAIRAEGAPTQNTPIVVVTGYSEEQMRPICSYFHVQSILEKPFLRHQFDLAIDQALKDEEQNRP